MFDGALTNHDIHLEIDGPLAERTAQLLDRQWGLPNNPYIAPPCPIRFRPFMSEIEKPMPNPVLSSFFANCGVSISRSVSGFRIAPFAVLPSAKRTDMNLANSFTVEYMQPAGAMPSSNVGAGNSRPW